jgi:hypothetical protein
MEEDRSADANKRSMVSLASCSVGIAGLDVVVREC